MELAQIDIDGPVHYIDTGSPGDGAPVIVLVHGLGASHLSWHPVVDELARTNRVLALDLPGFGHSEPLGRGTSVSDNRDVVVRFVRELAEGPVTLVGNSMGGMISVLAAHAHPSLVQRLVLVNPALPGLLNPRSVRQIDPTLLLHFALYNTPLVGNAWLKLRRRRTTPGQQVLDLLDLICTDPARVPKDTVDLLISLASARRLYAWSDGAFLEAQRSIMRMLSLHRTRYVEALDRLRMPTLLVHGEDDRLVNVGNARAVAPRNPRIDLVTMPGVGHAPQLEVPGELLSILERWMGGPARRDVA
ncbi:alpha/beta fold hydrolase [soil metagenome]